MTDAGTSTRLSDRSATSRMVLGLFLGACGPTAEEEMDPWGTLEIAYLASPTVVGDVMTRELRVTDVDGTNDVPVEHARPVTSDAVAWSPDGKRIAYVSELIARPSLTEVATSGGLYAADADGEELLAEILDTTGYGGSTPALSWSPRGDRIAMLRSGESWAFQCQMSALLLLVVDVDLGTPADERVDVERSDVAASTPAWAVDGGSVAVGAEYLICGDDGELDSFSWNIHLCGRESGSCQSSYGPSTQERDEWLGSWSPDGERIAVNVGTRYGPAGSIQLELWSADGNSAASLTSGECSHEGAAWFPARDRLITLRSCGDGMREHVIVDVSTADVVDVLPELGGSVSIAPDGERVLHVSGTDPSRIGIYDLNDHRVTTLAEGEAPVWRPR